MYVVAGLVITCSIAAVAQTDTLTILHINDTHSNLAPIGPRSNSLEESLGSIARAATVLDTNWQVTFLQHTILPNVAFERLNGDTLVAVYRGMITMLGVDSLTELRLVNRSRFLERVYNGAMIGSIVGAVLAALIVNPSSYGDTPYSKTEISIIGKFIAALFFGLEGGILGGTIGAVADLISAWDETLELSRVPPIQKPNLIRTFLVHHGVSKP